MPTNCTEVSELNDLRLLPWLCQRSHQTHGRWLYKRNCINLKLNLEFLDINQSFLGGDFRGFLYEVSCHLQMVTIVLSPFRFLPDFTYPGMKIRNLKMSAFFPSVHVNLARWIRSVCIALYKNLAILRNCN